MGAERSSACAAPGAGKQRRLLRRGPARGLAGRAWPGRDRGPVFASGLGVVRAAGAVRGPSAPRWGPAQRLGAGGGDLAALLARSGESYTRMYMCVYVHIYIYMHVFV